MPKKKLISNNESIHNSFEKANMAVYTLLHMDTSVIFYLNKEHLFPAFWDGCEIADLRTRPEKSFIKAIAHEKDSVYSIQHDECSLPELANILGRMDRVCGLAAPLFDNDNFIGIWIIASKVEYTFNEQDELLFQTLVDNINLTIQKEQLSVKNLNNLDQATAINEITREISQLVDLDRVLKMIVDNTYSLLDADVTGIALADEEAKVIKIRAGRGGVEKDLKKLVHPYGYGVGGWVATHRTPLLVDNCFKEVEKFSPLIREILATEGIISTICVPMSTNRKFVGVLYASSRLEAAFNATQLELLQVLGNQAAIAIENASLYEEQKLFTEKLRESVAVHERLLNLVLENQGMQVITDTLSELIKRPVIVESSQFKMKCFSCIGYTNEEQYQGCTNPISSKQFLCQIKEPDWFITSADKKLSIRVLPPLSLKEKYPRVVTPIVRAKTVLGYISAIEVDQPLDEHQRAAVEEASMIFALEFLKQETARVSMLQNVIVAQEDERKRIARELHDETSQALTALIIGMDSASMDIVSDPEKAQQRLIVNKSIADGMLDNIHRIISDLRPSLLDDLGLLPVIAWYSEQRLKPLGIDFYLENEGTEQRLSSAIEIVLYRIIQEAITNVIRHAGASKVTVRLYTRDDQLSLQIIDNGQGFDSRLLESTDMPLKSIGLWGIQERVSMLKGNFEIDTSPGQGTSLFVHVPLQHSEVVYE